MAEIKRQSPVQFKASPLATEMRDNWTVILEYEDEGSGPWLTDLAHKTRWDLQDGTIDELNPCEMVVPPTPGQCALSDGKLINRLNGTQASIYHLGAETPTLPDVAGYTDVSESTIFLALFGPKTFFIAEKLSNLDFLGPAQTAPFLLQGPFCHVPCQIVTLQKADDGGGGFLLSCSRGYGDSMVKAILAAGAEFGLKPAGENRFEAWVADLQ
jgi:hypothetical protein